MPNHVTNYIEAPKYVLDEILSVDDEGQVVFDFNSLIPMPDYIYTGNVGVEEMALYGENNSLDWCRKHWGTKWGSYSVRRESDTVLTFETAWSHPTPIIEALSKKFSNEPVLVAYADENSGHNLGVYLIEDELIVEQGAIIEGSFTAVKLAALLTGRDRVQIAREEIEELEKNWDDYKDYPGVDEELAGYKSELENYEIEAKYDEIENPDWDFNNLKSYLKLKL